MAGTIRISKRTIDALEPQAKRYMVYDSDLTGFGVRVTPVGTLTYFVIYRPHGGGRAIKPKEFTIGKHGALTPDQARKRAEEVLRQVASGLDPQVEKVMKRAEMTVAELCDLYLQVGCGLKKPRTLTSDRSRIRSHIKPLLGDRRISEVTQTDVKQFLNDVAAGKSAAVIRPSKLDVKREGLGEVETRKLGDSLARGGRGTATRTVGLLGGIFTFAMGHDDTKRFVKVNPVTGVKRFKDRRSERFLSPAELGAFGDLLSESQVNRKAIIIMLLLALTGARKSEIEALRRDEMVLHLSHLQMGDSKSGFKIIHLGAVALELLRSVDLSPPSPYVFPSTNDPEKPFTGTYNIWRRIRGKAGLGDVRLHDLRHTFASTSVLSTGSLALLARILGHSDIKTTEKYAHLADGPVKAAAETAAGLTASAMSRGADRELSGDQIAQAEKMLSIDIDPEVIARALEVPVALIERLRQQVSPAR